MDENRNKTINTRFRLLYALGMIFIVAGHANGGGISLFYEWFPPYSFHLGLFAFCSGYLYKDSWGDRPGEYVRRKFKRLILPMYLWNLFYALLVTLSRRFGFTIGLDVSFRTLVTLPIYEGSQFEYNMGAWFVVPLFMIEAVNVWFRRWLQIAKSPRREWAAFGLYLLLGGFGVWLAKQGFYKNWELAVTRALFFFPFFGAGLLYRNVLERFDRLPHGPYFALVLFLQYLLILRWGRIPTYTPSNCMNFIDGCFTPFAVGFLGIAFWLRIAAILEPALGKDRWLGAIADNSYSIMVNQFLGFMVIKAGFAVLKTLTTRCQNFDMAEFRSNLVYFYLPGGNLFNLVYLAAGLFFPVLMQKAVDELKCRAARLREKRTQAA